ARHAGRRAPAVLRRSRAVPAGAVRAGAGGRCAGGPRVLPARRRPPLPHRRRHAVVGGAGRRGRRARPLGRRAGGDGEAPSFAVVQLLRPLEPARGSACGRTSAVAVVAAGVATPLGLDLDSFWSALCTGVDGISAIERFRVDDLRVGRGGEIKKLRAPRKGRLPRCRASALLILAADDLLARATLPADPARLAVVVGTALGGVEEGERAMVERGARVAAAALCCGARPPRSSSWRVRATRRGRGSGGCSAMRAAATARTSRRRIPKAAGSRMRYAARWAPPAWAAMPWTSSALTARARR